MGAKFSSGGGATVFYDKTDTPGEIVTELVNATDGAGLDFDGSPGYIDISSPPDLGTKFSFEFVFKATTWTSGDYKFLLDFGGGSGRFIIGTNDSDNNLKIFDNVGYKDTGVVIFDDLDVHHVVVTVNGTSALVYDNGNQVGSATISASHGIDTATDAAIATNIFYSSNNAVTGTIYRARFYNRTLSADDVRTAFERADVPVIDQYGSQTELVTNGDFTSSSDWTGSDWSIGSGVASIDGSQTGSRKLSQNIGVSAGVRYRITYTISAYTTGQIRFLFASSDGGTYRNAAGTYSEEFVPTSSGSFHLQANASFNGSIDNVSVVRIGCVSDYDLAFANPTQSLTVQDRSGAADGTCSASGVTQVQPVVQLNSTSARIGTTAATPADGDLQVSGNIGVNIAPDGSDWNANSKVVHAYQNDGHGAMFKAESDSTSVVVSAASKGYIATLEAKDLAFWTNGNERLAISSAGAVDISGPASHATALTVGNSTGGTELQVIPKENESITLNSAEGATAHALILATGGTPRLTVASTGLATFSGGITVSGGITTLGSFSELTINSGQITITQSVHTVDTESDAATDDLDTINGGSTGSILVLKSVLGSRHVVLKDGTDNLRLNGDCELGTSNDTITLMKVSTVWREMSRSLN